MTAPTAPRVVVMGVSGCGKSTVGALLAQRLGIPFIEGDALHPPENVARMAAGVALTDADRAGWLDRVAEAVGAEPRGAVASCSALRRIYRDRLRAAVPGLRIVHLQGDSAVLAARLAERQHAYMPASLLPSQLATLEPPAADEGVLALSIASAPDVLAAEVERWLTRTPTGALA